MTASTFGRSIAVGNPSASATSAGGPLPLFIDVRLVRPRDLGLSAASDALAEPLPLLEAVIADLEGRSDSLRLLAGPCAFTTSAGYAAARATARVRVSSGQAANTVLYYLAAVLLDDRPIAVYATSPDSAGTGYLDLAHLVTASLREVEG